MARTGSVCVFDPAPLDRTARHLADVEPGLFVRVVQPVGCPKNGTMGHYFIEAAVTGEFIGLVHGNSLKPLSPDDRRVLRRQGDPLTTSRRRR